MATLHVPDGFPAYHEKLKRLDRPAADIVTAKLRQIRDDPFSGILLSDLASIRSPQFHGIVNAIRQLFDTTIPGQLSGIPEEAVWCVFDEVLLEGKTPPPRVTRAFVLYVPHGNPRQNAIPLQSLFPAAAATDVAAVLIAPVWVRSEWMLLDS